MTHPERHVAAALPDRLYSLIDEDVRIRVEAQVLAWSFQVEPLEEVYRKAGIAQQPNGTHPRHEVSDGRTLGWWGDDQYGRG